jgi:hypothetical protein
LISEETTHRLETNERKWRREYGAEFVPTFEDGFFEAALLDAATDKYRASVDNKSRSARGFMLTIDPAFRGDQFAYCVSHAWSPDGGLPQIVIDQCGVIAKDPVTRTVEPSRAVQIITELRRRFGGSNVVYSDQHQADALRFMFLRYGITLMVEPWTHAEKIERYSAVQTLFRDGRIRLPDDKALRTELSAVGLKRTPSGNEVISYRGAHDDRASAFVHAVWVALKYAPVMIPGEYQQQPIAVGERAMAGYFGSDAPRTIEGQIAQSFAQDVQPQVVTNARRRW